MQTRSSANMRQRKGGATKTKPATPSTSAESLDTMTKEELELSTPKATTVAASSAFFTASGTATTTYLLIWCMHALLPLIDTRFIEIGHGAYDSRPLCEYDLLVLYPLVLTILMLLSPVGKALFGSSTQILMVDIAVIAHAVDFAVRVYRMPALWDHECWGLCTEISFVLAYAPCLLANRSVALSESSFLSVVQWQFGMLYAAAAFWKLNTSFFDYQLSCGTLLLLEFVGAYIEPFVDIPVDIATLLAKAAPVITLLGEAGISIFMFLFATTKKPIFRDIGVALAVGFHTMIFLLPLNAAGGFSAACLSRFICFFDSAAISRLFKTAADRKSIFLAAGVLAIVTVSTLSLVRYRMIDVLPDTGLTFAGLLIVLYIFLVGVQPSYFATVAPGSGVPPPTNKLLLATIVVFTVAYAFVGPILGVQQMGASTMYGNMRNYGPSNHYFVPTAILGDDILFGGGLVQVIDSSSDTLDLKFGHVLSSEMFPERVLRLIAMARGRSFPDDFPVQLFPYVMTSHHSRGQVKEKYARSQEALKKAGTFLPYILPISTVSDALYKAVKSGEDFVVTLSGAGTSERVLMNQERRIVIGTNFSCKIILPGEDGEDVDGGDCEDDPTAKLLLHPTADGGFLQKLTKKLLIPYPRLVETEGEVCIT
jgi:hypothetical protein